MEPLLTLLTADRETTTTKCTNYVIEWWNSIMFLTLKTVQQPGESNGTIEVMKRKTICCRTNIGSIDFADDGEKEYLIDILTQNGLSGEVLP